LPRNGARHFNAARDNGCKLVAFKIFYGSFDLIKLSAMDEQKIRYRFVRAFVVEGLFAREGPKSLVNA